MSTTDSWLVSVLAVGLVLGLFYAATALVQLGSIRKAPRLGTLPDSVQVDATADRPTMRFRGEVFERSWQGSRGYDRPPDPRAGENLADRLFVTTFFPLRPSRFNDRSYWTRYLPGVLFLYIGLFLVAPLIVGAIAHSSIGRASSFMPTPTQRAVPRSGHYVGYPTDCDGRHLTPSAATGIDYTSGGKVIYVNPGGAVEITYLYGKPLFSPGSPLCPDLSQSGPGQAVYFAGASGSGFVYIPQPNGTVVAMISVVQSSVFGLQRLLIFVLFAISLTVLAVGIVLTLLIRSSMRESYT
jgi:hypothetical protein